MTYFTAPLSLQIVALALILVSLFFQYRQQARWAAFFSVMFVGVLFVKFLIDNTIPPAAHRFFIAVGGRAFIASLFSFVVMPTTPTPSSTATVALDRRRAIMMVVIGIAMVAAFCQALFDSLA